MQVITAIYRYPIKGCAAVPLNQAELDSSGVRDDRRLMLVSPDGAFLSQAKHPRMSLIQASIHGDVVNVNAPGVNSLSFSISESGSDSVVQFWFDEIPVVDQCNRASDWFSNFLGTGCRLVTTATEFDRSPPAESVLASRQRRFTDAGNVHLTTESSLAELNDRLEQPVGMDRFRPNIVVDGGAPFEEDCWKTLRLGSVELHATITCERCSIVSTNQQTGIREKEPLRTLAAYRKFAGGFGSGVIFGTHLDVDTPGRIRIGDTVEVVERGLLLGTHPRREVQS